ncbi:MAG: CPBP family intramembrane metalloprotease [Anaerolineae bacterium]|nr:CPBP family intramembrane metalloprotease [Anaerolineae bacterium]
MKNLRLFLAFLPAILGSALFVWALRLAFSSPARTAEWKLGLLSGAAGLCLLLAVTALGLWRRWRRKGKRELPSGAALALAYLAPALVLLWPVWVELFLRLPERRFWPALASGEGLLAGVPWFYLWNVIFLAGYAVVTRRSQIAAHLPFGLAAFRRVGWLVPLGLAAGLGLFLAAAFTFSIQARAATLPPLKFPLLLKALVVFAGVIVAPWAIELFFRGELHARWRARWGAERASLATAAIYAAVQFRLMLFLPAFLLGFGLAELTRRNGRLLPAVLAHALYNLLAIALGWWVLLL